MTSAPTVIASNHQASSIHAANNYRVVVSDCPYDPARSDFEQTRFGVRVSTEEKVPGPFFVSRIDGR
jgi:hypothetical protein